MVHLVGYEGGNAAVSFVSVDEDVIMSTQGFGPKPRGNGLLEGLVQQLCAGVHVKWLHGWPSTFTVDIYLERTRLTEQDERFKLAEIHN